MDEQECLLMVLRDELYGGSWEAMLQDLRDRIRRRPYLIRFVNRIREDIGRIERIRARETLAACAG